MNLKDLKIFVVDDDVFHLRMMRQILTSSGWQDVHIMENGITCLDRLYDRPDVIFLDHQMDTYNGYEILRKIKRFDPNIFVVMVSSQEEIHTAVQTLKYGAFDYIQKDRNLRENILTTLDRIDEVQQVLQKRNRNWFQKMLSAV